MRAHTPDTGPTTQHERTTPDNAAHAGYTTADAHTCKREQCIERRGASRAVQSSASRRGVRRSRTRKREVQRATAFFRTRVLADDSSGRVSY